jgi:hypothetical protein
MVSSPGPYDALAQYLLRESEKCLRPPVDRFRHPWLAPMPLSKVGAAYLAHRSGQGGALSPGLANPSSGDGFTSGDYSLGLFHHDASEAAIELLRHGGFRDGAAGSLLCLLDCAEPNGLVHRAELCHKAREKEPSKPVIAQYALRVAETLSNGSGWLERNRVYPRVVAFLRYLEANYFGPHGLFLTHSALSSGFDSDLLSAMLPDKSVEGPDTNAFMVLEYEALATLASRLGRPDSAEWSEKAARLRENVERLLWIEDEQGGYYGALTWIRGAGSLEAEYVGADSHRGRREPYESWISLLPLYAGVPSPARAEKLIRRMLDPARYWGPFGVRTLPANSPFFGQAPRVMMFDHKKDGRGPVSNWSGPVWVLSNFYLSRGLRRYGRAAEADALAHATARLLSEGLAREGALRECYDDAGRGLWPREGTFLSWNVLALTMLRDAGVAIAG